VLDAWYIAAHSHQLKRKPLPVTIHGTPLVLFRDDEGSAGCLLDRCPHRNVPLSIGKVVEGQLRCGYHGWRFDRGGRCTHVPALVGVSDKRSRCAAAYPVIEQQGFIWVYMRPGAEPEQGPYTFPITEGEPGYLVVRRTVQTAGSLHMVAENALDVPHTAFLHGGLFRTEEARGEIETEVRRWHDRVECEYIGEARPSGIVGRLLSPSGGVVVHHDRFFLPSVVQVEYSIGTENHVLVTAFGTPVDAYETQLHAVVAIRTRFPGWLIRPFIQPLALWIFHQDRTVLRLQTEAALKYGSAHMASTDVDLLGPHIMKLMRRAERGDLGPVRTEPRIKRGRMLV
jgi:phenylpropionate dioxygenase-like ring-hydroxylating dioxygenase large terminal subunit